MTSRLTTKILVLSTLVAIMIIYSSCRETAKSTSIDDFFKGSDSELVSSVNYANGFDIYNYQGISKMVIYNPRNLDNILSTYYFIDSDRKGEFPDSKNIIQYPIDSVAVFSTTQLNAFSKLGLLNNVIAISESEYIRNEEVKSMFADGRIVNLASNGNFYLEKTLELNPRIIFYSPWNMAQKHPLAETMITMIPFFDFMESDPLGRAEWIKFTALFFGKEKEAEIIFDTIVNKYKTYHNLTVNIEDRPTVFSDKYFGGQWFVAGGSSYIAQLFNDAGADYLWKDNNSSASFNLEFEVVLQKAHDADFWRIVGTYPQGFSYDKLAQENELYKNFDAFKNRKIVFCDSKKSTYFETGTLEPHIVLADLIKAFHPELMIDHNPVYYKMYLE